METEARLLAEAQMIARGQSGLTPRVHHLIVLDMALQRLQDANAVLLQTLEEMDGLTEDSRTILQNYFSLPNPLTPSRSPE